MDRKWLARRVDQLGWTDAPEVVIFRPTSLSDPTDPKRLSNMKLEITSDSHTDSRVRRVVARRADETLYVHFRCPGCDTFHTCRDWTWNGSEELPTLSPSVLVTYDGKDAGEEGAPPAICHSFVRDGRIQFLTDSTHKLAGMTVDLPEWRADLWTV